MKLMQNGLFIDEIWAKIAVGTLSYRWNLILAVESQIESNMAVGSLYYRWNSNLVVGSTQALSGPSDHTRERTIFCKNGHQKIGDISPINWHPRRFFLKIADLSLIVNISSIFCEKSALRLIFLKCCVICLRYAIYRRYFATFSSLVKMRGKLDLYDER